MVERIIQMFRGETSGLHQAAFLLGLFAFFSQILALVRDKLLAHNFGAGAELDIYYAAFRVPDFLFVTVGSVVSLSVLIPYLTSAYKQGEKETHTFINSIFTTFSVFIVIASAIVFLFMKKITLLVFPGFDDVTINYVVTLSKILLLSPVLLGISNMFGSLAQSRNRFLIYAVSPLMYNLGIIVGIVALLPLFGLYGLAWGVVLGAFLHLLIQVPVVSHLGLLPRFSSKLNIGKIKQVISLSFPRTIALSITHIASIFLLSMASTMNEGSIAVFNLAWNLQSVPLSIFGVSYSLAAFPDLSRFYILGEKDKFIEKFLTSVKHITFWLLPVVALFIVLRAHIVRIIFGSGEFDWSDTRLTAATLSIFAISLVFQAIILLCLRALYATGVTGKPFSISILSGIVIVSLAFYFKYAFEAYPLFKYFIEALFRVSDLPGTSVLALPLGFTIGSIFEAILLWVFFARNYSRVFAEISRSIFQVFSASIIMGFATYIAIRFFNIFFSLLTFWGVLAQGVFSAIVGILLWWLVLVMLNNRELSEIISAFKSNLKKVRPTSPDSSMI